MKKFLSLILATLMVMLSIPMTAAAEEGVPEGYIPVRTVEDLYNVRNDLTANYIMMNDIDLTEATAEGGDWDYMGKGWDPISGTFSGIFDGNDHSIIGMRKSGSDDGLFSSISGTIADLTMVDVNISGGTTVGAIAGTSSGATIENCHVYGRLTGTKTNLGGFIGKASNTTFTICSNHATVTGGAYVGGIVGYIDSGSIEYCYNTGDIFTDYNYGYYYYDSWSKTILGTKYYYYWKNYAGGIAAEGSACVISNCYNVGSITGKTKSYSNTGSSYYYANCAGIVSTRGTVNYCYNIGTINTMNTGSKNYGIGEKSANPSYYLSTSGSSSTGAKSLTEAQMSLQSVYTGFDFENTWMIVPYGEYPYPQLRSNPQNLLEKIEKIEIQSLPEKQIYRLNETLSFDGGQILATYASGNTEVIDITADMVTGIDTSVEGEQTATVTHRGCTATFDVYVTSSFMTELALVSKPSTTVYLEGDELNLAGMVVSANFADESSFIVEDYTVSGYDSTPGTKTVTISFNGYEVSFDVKVIAKTLTSVKLTTEPTKTVYLEGDELDMTGAVLTAYYNNGTSEIITDYELTGFTSTPGVNTIAVSYLNKITTFTVNVNAKSMTEIVVSVKPEKLVYLEGDAFDADGMKVIARYDNNTESEITDYTVSGYDSAPGTKLITVSYNGFEAQFTVTITAKTMTGIEIVNKPSKLTYLEGDAFDPAGLTVKTLYDNGDSENVTDYTVTGYDSTPGSKTITVSYNNFKATFTVQVQAKSLTEIVITAAPTKAQYIEGQILDTAGLVVTANYNNGTSEEITNYSLSGYKNTVGAHTVTVTYGGKTATFDVRVIARVVTSIEVTKMPNKVEYLEGDEIVLAGLEVTATYNDGTTEKVADYICNGYDSTPGEKTISVMYSGCTASFTVNVKAKTFTHITITYPTKLTYFVGEELDTAGLTVTAFYDNGTSEVIESGKYAIEGFDSSAVGTKDVTVSYNGKTQSFSVTIVESPVTIVYGDVNGDGKINLTDVSTILKHIAKWDIEMGTDAADVTGDGKVNLADVSLILKYIAKWDVVLGK